MLFEFKGSTPDCLLCISPSSKKQGTVCPRILSFTAALYNRITEQLNE